MNKNILLSICLLLISMAGVGCVSAADTTNTGMSDLSQIAVEENIDQKQDVVSNANNNFITNIPNKKFEKNQNNNKIVTKNKNNTQKSNITGPKIKPNLNITGPKIKNGDDYLGIKGPKINPPEKYNIIGKTENFKANNTEMFIALANNNKGQQKVVCYALNGAGASVVSDTGDDIIRLLNDLGVIEKAAYYTAKLNVKLTLWVTGQEASDAYIKYWTYRFAFGGVPAGTFLKKDLEYIFG